MSHPPADPAPPGPVWDEVARAFGLSGVVRPLVGERTTNAVLTGPDGREVAVLKLHEVADAADLEVEAAALRHLAGTPVAHRVPRVIDGPAGAHAVEVATPDGPRLARALTWVPGRTWRPADATAAGLRALGTAVARLDAALAGFDHPGADRSLRWNLLEAGRALDLLDAVPDPERRALAGAVLRTVADRTLPVLAALPRQVLHHDANPANVVLLSDVDGDGDNPDALALIDFGDLCRAPRVAGLAVALAYAAGSVPTGPPGPEGAADVWRSLAPLVSGYHAVTPLTPDELALLPDLARARLAVSVVMSGWQHARDPGNAYLVAGQDEVWTALRRLDAADDHLALCRVRQAAGFEPCPRSGTVRAALGRARPAPVLGVPLRQRGFRVLDWTGADPQAAEPQGQEVLVGSYREDRSVYTTQAFATPDGERRTVHLGVDLFRPPGEPVHAPLAGVVELCADNDAPLDYGPLVVLRHELEGQGFFTLYGHLSRDSLTGLRPGQTVAAGEVFARTGTRAENGGWAPHVHVQVLTDLVGLGRDVPGVASRGDLDLWSSLCPDPAPLVGLPSRGR